jgi:hypothetical protein
MKMSTSDWKKIPSERAKHLVGVLNKWDAHRDFTTTTGTAALMLYVALNFMAEDAPEEENSVFSIARVTYDGLEEATGLSRASIAKGLSLLEKSDVIRRSGSNRSRVYFIFGDKKQWFKLPCKAIISGERITPFNYFNLRTRVELDALKLYFCLGINRSNFSAYSMTSYEKFHEMTRIDRNQIHIAISFLLNSKLLSGIDREQEHSLNQKTNKPNRYYLSGYRYLLNNRSSGASESSA